ncbi:Vesicular-fusion protein sec18 [Ceratocystis fimbriata CBS 114723]|uniref:Vesicular-fusion protein SEC18 n=1 Tax=Ceratocystis fimbriata CBS 114723 TaxID=1035309 RepID=A0A2C5XFJ8_9PEZI|nr:Vesicular-fusion protein sec18 [Ceratocystis fimbriata CBS 114723]
MSRNGPPYTQPPHGPGGGNLPPRRPAPNDSNALFGNRGAAAPSIAPGGYSGGGGYGQAPSAPRQHPMASRGPPSEKPRGGSNGPAINLQVAKVEDKTMQTRLIYENVCAVSSADFSPNPDGSDIYVLITNMDGQEFVVTARPMQHFPRGCISLSEPQRNWARISVRDTFTGHQWTPFQGNNKQVYIGTMDVEIGFASPNKKTAQKYKEDDLQKLFTRSFENHIVQPGQRILMDVSSIPLLVVVKTVTLIDLGMSVEGQASSRNHTTRGIITSESQIVFHRDAASDLQMEASMKRANTNAIIAPDFKFEDMGIGGLAGEFATIFRRAFASRIFPPAMVQKLGIQHVKGILMYGPPGTGKTLMARQIGKMLNSREPKIINGPEILNKFVGQSEENVRKMFADAEKEYKEKGDESGLHVIIFDELDAVCKQRGSGAGGGTGVGDSVVNQLLTKLDGVDQLNNILLIGMTNRKDMIDEALLRPGRLEVQLEISLPNEEGRLQILKIHTSKMRDNDVLGNDVDLISLAAEAKNYSGAELSGLVKAATSFAFSRHTKIDQLAGIKEDVANMKVTMADFEQALREVRPAYGVDEQDLDMLLPNGIIKFNPEHIQDILNQGERSFNTIREAEGKRHQAILFHGVRGAGKTALAAEIARMSQYPFVKVLSPKDLLPYRDEMSKIDYINRVFANAYRSPLSLVLIDNFDRLIDWSPIGPRFSNNILATLQTLISTPPPKDHRLLVFCTTSKLRVLKLLEVDDVFDKKIDVRPLRSLNELATVMDHSRVFDRNQIQNICGQIQDTAVMTEAERRKGQFSVELGIKTVLDFLFEAKAASKPREDGSALDPGPIFLNLMVDAINAAKVAE